MKAVQSCPVQKLKDEEHGQSCKEACREEGCQEAGGEEEEVRVSCLVPRNLVSRLLRASVVPAAVLISVLSAAQAASVTNRDDVDRKVTIIESGTQKDHVLKKGEVLEGVCQRGCSIRIDGDDVNPYVLEGTEVTAIEGGDLYAEGQGPLGSPRSGASGQPSKPGP
ncbi:MAG: hypothetical protein B7Z29_15650 [Hyphomicrobium sp. 12-62-95]|nr:MAG: hypothetical protein B7Z29_15650 [Hyphomicrobium sp. 12-62-95]